MLLNILLNIYTWSQIVVPVIVVAGLLWQRGYVSEKPYLIVGAGIFMVLYFVFALFIAGWLGQLAGCERFDEGSTTGCVLLGTDISSALYGLFLTGWLGMFVVPTGILIAGLGSVLFFGAGAFTLMGILEVLGVLFAGAILYGFVKGLFGGA